MEPILLNSPAPVHAARKQIRPRSRASVLRVLRAHLPALSKKYGIVSLGIFGSYARGDQKPTSDLDVLVEYAETPTLSTILNLEQELSALVGTNVESHELENLRTYIYRNVMRQVIWLQKDRVAQKSKLARRLQKGKPHGENMQDPKREYLDFLQDMVESMELAQEYVRGMTYDQMIQDRKTRDPVERTLERVGEAAARVPDEIRKMYSDIPWLSMVGMRNIIAHRYDRVSYEIIWDTIHNSIPQYLPKVREMVAAELKRRGMDDAEKN